MYASRPICGRCASQLHIAVAHKRAVAHAYSTWTNETIWADIPGASPDRNENASHSRKPIPQRRPSSFAQRFGRARRPPSHSEDSALALFNDVVRPSDSDKPNSGTTDSLTSKGSNATQLGEWDLAAKLKELSGGKRTAQEKIVDFHSHIWPHLRGLGGQMPRHLYLATTQFLANAVDEVARNGYLGSSLELSQMCSAIGVWDLDIRNALVLNACYLLIQPNTPEPDRVVLAKELVDLWQHITQLRRRSQDGQPLQFALPTSGEVLRDVEHSRGLTADMHPLTRALVSIFLQYPPQQARELIPGLITTLCILSDTKLVRVADQRSAGPLINIVAAVLKTQGHIEKAYFESLFKNQMRYPSSKLPALHTYVVDQWPIAASMMTNQKKARSTWQKGLADAGGSGVSALAVLSTAHKQLRLAYRSRNSTAILAVWQDLNTKVERRPDFVEELRKDPDFFDFWIHVWCAVRRPSLLQETLNLMAKLDMHPTLKSYTAMLHGWKICKDVSKIEALWEKLVASGAQLDTVIWTARISGLIELGKPEAGIAALAEMLQKSKQSPNSPRPTIEVVNAVFTGLINLDSRAAYEVLDWASREGISPNIRTYNTLLRTTFRNNPGGVSPLLKSMVEHNIQPDAASFTIILEEVLGGMNAATASEQVQAVEQILSDIQSAGLRPNLETYAKMLYSVTSLENGSDEAVKAVEKHMHANGYSATPHMITILIERAIRKEPPNIAAVKALLKEYNLTDISKGDQTLWERVMSAHAVSGDAKSAMAVFDDLAIAGRPVTSLPCLTDLLKSLMETDNRRDDAQRVVNVVIKHKRATKEDFTQKNDRYWRHHFWFLVREHGLWRSNEATSKLQEGEGGKKEECASASTAD